jgi:lysophospholipid acyltransferase (LPLAT)-like uncharacterized protein
MGSLRVRSRCLDDNVDPYDLCVKSRYIYTIWHENLLLGLHLFRRANICCLMSRHADGQLLAEVGRHMRVRLVRGSTTRGGVEAIRTLIKESNHRHLALAPDGSKGPRRQVQQGVIYIAARTGLPVVAAGIGFERPWRTQSWDRLAVPRPWTRATWVSGTPLCVPPRLDRREVETHRQLLEADLHRVTALAEVWANTGSLDCNRIAG